MTLVQTEPKSIKIGNTAIKRVTIRPNGTEKQIRPVGWTPGANTLLYLPLKTDAIDQSGNNRGTSDSGVTYTTVDGVQCAYFGTNGGVVITNDFIGTSLNQKTISTWVYIPEQTSSQERIIFYALRTNQCFSGLSIDLNSSYITSFVSNGTNIQTPFTANTWFHIVATGSSSESAIYINGQKVVTGTGDTYPRGTTNATFNVGTRVGATFDGRSWLRGYLSEFILEDKARTAQEVLDYFNPIKGNYGL